MRTEKALSIRRLPLREEWKGEGGKRGLEMIEGYYIKAWEL